MNSILKESMDTYNMKHKSPKPRRVLKIQKLKVYLRKGTNSDKKHTIH